MGMQEIVGLLEQWCMDEAEVRRRMYRAPTPRERERWHAVWLLTQGWTAAAVGRALERDAHTIGQWAKAFAEGGPKALVFEQTGGSPRVGHGAMRGVEKGGAGVAIAGRHRTVQLELEGGAAICGGPFRVDVEPQWLSELPASVGICAEASQEAATQGGPGVPGRLCGGICRSYRCCPTNWSQDILRRRGPLSG